MRKPMLATASGSATLRADLHVLMLTWDPFTYRLVVATLNFVGPSFTYRLVIATLNLVGVTHETK